MKMDSIQNYAKMLLVKCLNVNKKDSLFISISSKNTKFANILKNQAEKLGIKDIYIYFHNEPGDIKKWGEYIENNSRFLFIVDDDWYDTVSYAVYNGFSRGEIDIIYTVSIDYRTLSNNSKMILRNIESIVDYNIEMSKNAKLGTTIKNFRLNQLFARTLCGTKLRMQFNNNIKSPVFNKRMNRYPNYALEFMPVSDTVEGYIEATKTTYYGKHAIEGLRLIIKNGIVVDFDSENEHEFVNEIFKKSNFYRVQAIGLVGKEVELYNNIGTYGNFVLDKTSNPYILLCSGEGDNIYVPIESESLQIYGFNSSKEVIIYENEDYSQKVKTKK